MENTNNGYLDPPHPSLRIAIHISINIRHKNLHSAFANPYPNMLIFKLYIHRLITHTYIPININIQISHKCYHIKHDLQA